jgi:hypothetical protein
MVILPIEIKQTNEYYIKLPLSNIKFSQNWGIKTECNIAVAFINLRASVFESVEFIHALQASLHNLSLSLILCATKFGRRRLKNIDPLKY